MASSSDLVKAPTVAATSKGPQALLKSCARLGEAAGVAPSVVHTILEHVQKLTVDALQQLKPFALHGIATFTRRLCKAKAASSRTIQGHKFTTRPVPEVRRVECTVASPLQRAVSSSVPYASIALTPAAQLLSEKLATLIGERDITAAVVVKVMTALRNAIVQDLRISGMFAHDGHVRFQRSEAKARPVEYAHNAIHGKVILHGAAGPCMDVYCGRPDTLRPQSTGTLAPI